MVACARRTERTRTSADRVQPSAPEDGSGPAAGDGDAGSAAADTITQARPDRQQILAELVRVVFLPTYSDLAAASGRLAGTLATVRASPIATNLAAAWDAWRACRAVWRLSNPFGIGPGDDLAITSGIIDEPTNVQRLEALLADTAPLDPASVRSLPANVRGLLALEHLLFRPDVGIDEAAEAFAGRQGQRRALYAQVLGADLHTKLEAVRDNWTMRFGQEVEQAGRGSSDFRRERDAYDALMNKALAIADRAIDILRQATGGAVVRTALPVSARSDNVAADLVQDLRGLEALYRGELASAAAVSISDAVRDINPAADVEMRAALAAARPALEALPRPLRVLSADAPAIVLAIGALRMVKAALATGVFNALGVSLGFTDNDGD